MKIRWKLLILLLAIGLLPLLLVGWVDRMVILRLGRDLAGDMRADLTDAAQEELERVLGGYARLLERERRLMEQILQRQAEAVERRLAGEDTAAEAPVFFAEDFDAAIAGRTPPDHGPPGLFSSTDHAAWAADGTLQPQMVSWATQVIRLAPGTDRQQLAGNIRALADMTEVYHSLRASYPEAILWQYTSLETGVHSAYPGKGGYPQDYEPRDRHWYTLARDEGDTIWISPMADVSTGRVMITAAMPLYLPDGSFAGVTAVDSPVERVLAQTRLPEAWSGQAEMMLLLLATPEECEDFRVLPSEGALTPIVFAESSVDEGRQDWRKRAEYRVLASDDPNELAVVMDDMRQQLTGVRDLTYQGRQCVVSYSSIGREDDERGYLLVIVPKELIVQKAVEVGEDVIARMWHNMAGKALMLMLVLIVVILLAWKGSQVVTRPVTELAEAANRISDGELEARVAPGRGSRELAELADAFNSMVPKLRDRVRIRQSLHVAMEVQQSLLPAGPPKIEGLDIAGRSLYCDETGGDYYDFLQFEQLGENRVAVVIGDVVGHGVAAALLMATVRALLRSRAALTGSLEDLFTDVNRQLCESQFTGRFMTLFYMVLDTSQKTIRFLSAGHDPAIVYHPQDNTFEEMRGEDIPLGLEPGWQFHESAAADWRSGQIIVLGTDGIWECFNAEHEMFGKERLREVIRTFADRSADAISHAVQEAVAEFRGHADQTDDITLVVVKID
ncbi:MAG: SpoIIE family protein phosphatase [Phycisphaerales bacterium]|nr:MAG: SpoIIE family protein phosphatase [Phycisphaerales bacterium]